MFFTFRRPAQLGMRFQVHGRRCGRHCDQRICSGLFRTLFQTIFLHFSLQFRRIPAVHVGGVGVVGVCAFGAVGQGVVHDVGKGGE